MVRPRIRQLGLTIGALPTGTHNAITDVRGVWVGHSTVIRDQPSAVRTGITVITARDNSIWTQPAFSAWHGFNGNGEMTGIPWIEESGMLGSAIALTNTHQVGMVRDALVRYSVDEGFTSGFLLPVVSETFDGWLSDIDSFALTEEDVYAALREAAPGPVAEGNVGGGTGMICHEFKGGIGTASRVITVPSGAYTVGVLVQANYGSRTDLRIDGIPVGRLIGSEVVPAPWPQQEWGGSIVVVTATDAPLIPVQCRRLARRSTVGLARVGGTGHNGSGDLYLCFATGNSPTLEAESNYPLQMVPHHHLDPFFYAVADATEEAILNALCAAETMTGFKGRTAHALPLDRLADLINRRPW
jgi:D-aminopeptidase